MRFSSLFLHFHRDVTVILFQLTVFPAFLYRVLSRPSHTTFVSILYLWLVISVSFTVFIQNL